MKILEFSIFFMTENFLFSGDALQRLNEAPLEPEVLGEFSQHIAIAWLAWQSSVLMLHPYFFGLNFQ